MSELFNIISSELKCKTQEKVDTQKAYIPSLSLCRKERDAISTFVMDNHKLYLLNAWLP